ncbi:MAG: TonB-dependent receptor [Bacteroidales bacterium]
MNKKNVRVFSFMAGIPKVNIVMKLITMLLLLVTIQAFSVPVSSPDDDQQLRITGKVTDPSGEALPGVNILEKGTLNGAISDASGNFAISVASANSVLTFSFVGYITREVVVGAQTSITVSLAEAVSALDEIVVVGYSTQARKSLTGSVSTVNAAAISESTSTNPIQRIQGKVAGVTILNQHTPGAGATIRIRGMTTINDSNPLYVVDGVPGGTYSPNDVETITILKDAAAQSIYGARAANGVVLITTKGGRKNQKVSFNVNVRQGVNVPGKFYDLLNTQEWGEMLWLEAKNAGVPNYTHPQYGSGATPVVPYYIFPTAGVQGDPRADLELYDNKLAIEDGTDTYLITRASVPGTDWYGEATRNASYKEYTMDIAGGSQNTSYAFLMGYTHDEGIFNYTGFERYSFRTNISSSPANWMSIGTNIGVQYYTSYGQQNDNSESSLVSWAYRMPPIVPVYDEGGNFAGSRPTSMGNSQSVMHLQYYNQWDNTKRLTASGNAFLQLNPVKGLALKTLIGVNTYGQKSQDYNFVNVADAERGTYDSYSIGGAFALNWTWTNTIEYSIVSGQHNIKAIAGTEAYDSNSSSLSANQSWYPFKNINYMTLGTGLRTFGASDGYSEYSLFSIFGRVNYSFADRYLLEAVVRRDGSSRFGNQKFGVFPAFSLGWRVTEEAFMASAKSWLNELKIRVGYGVVGNDRMGNYNSYTQFAFHESHANYALGGSNTAASTGFRQSTFGNADVKWETTSTVNLGFDATLLNNFTLNLDLWQRNTEDMLYPKQLPLVLGTASRPSINIGSMRNTGFDLEIGYNNSALNGDLTYNAGLVFSRYVNELVKLTDVESDFYQGSSFREKPYTRTQTGRAFPEFYGYIVEGIFQSQAEVDAWPKAFGENGTYNAPGHFKYKDVDGNGYIDAGDRTYIGSPHPDFTAGLSLSLDYKGFSVSTTLYASVGNDMVNYVSRFIDFTQFASGKSKRRLYESWGSPHLNGDNTKATMPIIYNNDTPHQEPSTFFLEDASFLRMKNLRIGYDVNRLLNNRFNSLQLYFQGSNLFTMTKYSGLDPEISSGGINMGVDSGAWPTPQQFLFGISFGL